MRLAAITFVFEPAGPASAAQAVPLEIAANGASASRRSFGDTDRVGIQIPGLAFVARCFALILADTGLLSLIGASVVYIGRKVMSRIFKFGVAIWNDYLAAMGLSAPVAKTPSERRKFLDSAARYVNNRIAQSGTQASFDKITGRPEKLAAQNFGAED